MTKPPDDWKKKSTADPMPLPLPEVLPREFCSLCGCLIGDLVVHDAWHADGKVSPGAGR